MLTGWRKARLRKNALERRMKACRRQPDAARALITQFPDAAWPAVHAVVAGYRPVRGEIDPAPLMETFLLEQSVLALPVVAQKAAPLQFRAYAPGDTLEARAYGIEEPESRKPLVTPSLVLVPLVAFDSRCHRLGYGGGYYDRTLAALKAQGHVISVGLAFEAQKVSRLPSGMHDIALDYVVTETACYASKTA
ncbi:MAG: 5-formyltetrahydrofolate cyclo-ligase [Oceanicaulis sp.]|uniref:5-formyltetrahydrofolate cyclo-ligase n=1 Tax=Glycocaulis sp. TaxID=1969725 RepID=UPI0025B7FC25|nr:5-formyltetrahydrofolate cyclo-ligase [Glycocaulis sp.]MCC5981206.1 5-formyltetrahydrofolate cyclo-ligase [Oceanicaulis sp.]MCH8520487.1 5-formyltetrahydrofolate cyclo-ligase [Glycocaulis sp.]